MKCSFFFGGGGGYLMVHMKKSLECNNKGL